MSDPASSVRVMIIDCGTCQVAGLACGDCFVSVLLGPPAATVRIEDEHRVAIGVLTDAGLIPPLRLVPTASPSIAHRVHSRQPMGRAMGE